jgi:hypothetical protein
MPPMEEAGLERRIAALEARLAAPDWRYAPPLWQDVGRAPLPSVGTVLENVAALAGDDASAQAAHLAERVASGAIGTHAAAPLVAELGDKRL